MDHRVTRHSASKTRVNALMARPGDDDGGGWAPPRPEQSTLPERRLAAAPPVVGRLISDARMVAAIRQCRQWFAAAEEELRGGRIADRPAAGVFVELQQRTALADGNDILDHFRFGLVLHLECQSQRRIAPHRWT